MHQRKRHTDKKAKQKSVGKARLAPYPHPNSWVRRLDQTMVVIAILGPLFNLPQVLKIYVEHQVAGLAITTWILLLVLKVPWITYAVVHKAKPLLITSILWACSHASIIAGILIYS